jgi:hypothetical protein
MHKFGDRLKESLAKKETLKILFHPVIEGFKPADKIRRKERL